MKPFQREILRFQKTIFDYYKKHGREFPWRPRSHASGGRARGTGNLDPYSVLVSEVMLQQTQVDRVIPKYRAWIKEFPTVTALARAPLKKVLLGWSGLGYNRRALYLKRAAEILVREHEGNIPREVKKLRALPGVGPYTAAAVLAFAWNEPMVFIETNIRAVYLHFFFRNRKKVSDEEILEVVERTLPVPPNNVQPFSRFPPTPKLRRAGKVEPCSVREWYNALMDYGAMLKQTVGNQNARSAHYARQSRFKGSRRELRGEILRRAILQKSITHEEFANDIFSISDVATELVNEGFLRRKGNRFTLA